MNSLRTQNVYSLVPVTIPHGMEAVGTRWVFNIRPDGTFKGRLVVQAWGQVPDIDCGRAFTLVYRLQSVRMLVAAVAEMDWEACQLDVQTAFLHAPVRNEVYVEMVPYRDRGSDGDEISLISLWLQTRSPKLVDCQG